MKKSILNLKGAQELTKNEQKSVNGNGGISSDSKFPVGSSCNGNNPWGAPYCCVSNKIDICGWGSKSPSLEP